jgi:hypothetical protein
MMFPKPNIPRLRGKDLKNLRVLCFMKYGGICQDCGRRVFLDADEAAPYKADMAHRRGKRNHGDTLDNTILLCHEDHMRRHNGGKPYPSKTGGSDESIRDNH